MFNIIKTTLLFALASVIALTIGCNKPAQTAAQSEDTAVPTRNETASENGSTDDSRPELAAISPKQLNGTNLLIEPTDPEAAPAVPVSNVAVPNAGPVPVTTASLPITNDCIATEKDWAFELSFFAEKLEKQKIMYTQTPADALADCSGIFYRITEFVATTCQNYQYPDPKTTRDSRAIARWFHDHNNLVLINDPKASRNLIRPGSVMFFGHSGERYDNVTLDKIAGTGQQRGVINHVGVVTEVKRDDAGNVIGYVMMHGRRKGVAAERTHYHQLDPPRFGYPVLGNWEQQWLAVANIMTPASSTQVIAANAPSVPAAKTGSTASSSPGPASSPAKAATATPTDALLTAAACVSEEQAWSNQLSAFAESLEKKNLMYTQKPAELLQDCSGIFFRFAQYTESQCQQAKYPDPTKTRDSRSIARWYHDNGNLAIIQDAKASRNLIKPGSVMFFGGSGARYSNLTIEKIAGTPQARGVITHVGVVTEVTYDDAGNVTGYVMMHGRRPGLAAERSHYHKIEPPRLGYPVLGNWNQQWVAVANIMTPVQ